FTTITAAFNFVPADIDIDFVPSDDQFIQGYTGTTWFNTSVDVLTSTQAEFVNLASARFPNNQPRSFQVGRSHDASGFNNRLTGILNCSNPTTWINALEGAIQLTNGSSTITGVATKFTDLVPGDQIVLQASPSSTPLIVSSVANDVSLLLSSQYTGTTRNGGY